MKTKFDLTRVLRGGAPEGSHRTGVHESAEPTVPLSRTDAGQAEPTRLQTVGAAPRRRGPREVTVIAIDISGSMAFAFDGAKTRLDGAVRAAQTFIVEKARNDPDDLVGLIAFNAAGWPILAPVALRHEKPRLLRELRDLRPGGGTDLCKALACAGAAMSLNAPGVVNRVVLITDGHGGNPKREARFLKDSGVVIDCIGIGDTPSDVREDWLRDAASVVNGLCRYVFAKDMDLLTATFTAISAKTQVC